MFYAFLFHVIILFIFKKCNILHVSRFNVYTNIRTGHVINRKEMNLCIGNKRASVTPSHWTTPTFYIGSIYCCLWRCFVFYIFYTFYPWTQTQTKHTATTGDESPDPTSNPTPNPTTNATSNPTPNPTSNPTNYLTTSPTSHWTSPNATPNPTPSPTSDTTRANWSTNCSTNWQSNKESNSRTNIITFSNTIANNEYKKWNC